MQIFLFEIAMLVFINNESMIKFNIPKKNREIYLKVFIPVSWNIKMLAIVIVVF